MRLLTDTNILLRAVNPNDPNYQEVRVCLEVLRTRGDELCYASQSLAEFWNVSTRPVTARSSYGLSIAETNRRTKLIENEFSFLSDDRQAHDEWRQLVVNNAVKGVHVFDARLVTTMKAYTVTHLLTLNGADFKRYQGIVVISPQDVIDGRI
ncbi:MAG: hypothetical protein NVSMB56_14200 [Pyrinomonadaceae bacterium]